MAERAAFSWWEAVIADFTPRIAVPRPIHPHWIIYTDAASTPAQLCALLFKGGTSEIRLVKQCSAPASAVWHYLFRYTNLIYGIELFSLVLFFEDWAPLLKGSCCWVYLDNNNNCLSALVRGGRTRKLLPFWLPVSGD